MANEIYDWSLVAANNSNADASINWAEGQPASSVNNSARVMMSRVKALINDLSGVPAATGTANAVSVTTSVAFTEIAAGRRLTFRASANNSGAMTLNVNSIGAEPLLKLNTSGVAAMVGGEVKQDGIYEAVWCSWLDGGGGAWLLLNPTDLPAVIEVPPGIAAPFAGTTAPSGWLKCNGAAISRATYAGLFAAIGTTWGAGDGSTTFNLPDWRGEFVRGWDDGRGLDAGRAFASVQGQTIQLHDHPASSGFAGAHGHSATSDVQGSHTHGVVDPGHRHDWGNAARGLALTPGNAGAFAQGGAPGTLFTTTEFTGISLVANGAHNHNITVSNAGDHSHTVTVGAVGNAETRPRNVTGLWIIKT